MSLVEELSSTYKGQRKALYTAIVPQQQSADGSYIDGNNEGPGGNGGNGNGPLRRLSRSTGKKKKKINYNLAALELLAHGNTQEDEEEMMTRDEKKSFKRLQELDRENYNEQYMSRIEIPKNLRHEIKHSQTLTLKRILNSKKTLVNYLDENESLQMKRLWSKLEVPKDEVIRTRLLLCSICGNNSKYSCVRCLTRFCSVKCGQLHNETRCSTYTG